MDLVKLSQKCKKKKKIFHLLAILVYLKKWRILGRLFQKWVWQNFYDIGVILAYKPSLMMTISKKICFTDFTTKIEVEKCWHQTCTKLHEPAPSLQQGCNKAATSLHQPAPACTNLHQPAPTCTNLRQHVWRHMQPTQLHANIFFHPCGMYLSWKTISCVHTDRRTCKMF